MWLFLKPLAANNLALATVGGRTFGYFLNDLLPSWDIWLFFTYFGGNFSSKKSGNPCNWICKLETNSRKLTNMFGNLKS